MGWDSGVTRFFSFFPFSFSSSFVFLCSHCVLPSVDFKKTLPFSPEMWAAWTVHSRYGIVFWNLTLLLPSEQLSHRKVHIFHVFIIFLTLPSYLIHHSRGFCLTCKPEGGCWSATLWPITVFWINMESSDNRYCSKSADSARYCLLIKMMKPV
jgi:hypothetical protein